MTEQSLAELAGHDLAAMGLLSSLAERYRRDGLPGLRAAVEAMGFDAIAETLLVEAVLTIAERTGTSAAHGRRAWERLEAEDARTEAAQTRQGGNR